MSVCVCMCRGKRKGGVDCSTKPNNCKKHHRTVKKSRMFQTQSTSRCFFSTLLAVCLHVWGEGDVRLHQESSTAILNHLFFPQHCYLYSMRVYGVSQYIEPILQYLWSLPAWAQDESKLSSRLHFSILCIWNWTGWLMQRRHIQRCVC